MIIRFYECFDEHNKLEKTLDETKSKEIEIVMKTNFDYRNFNIELSGIKFDDRYNYCYIPKLNRYYFVSNMGMVRNSLTNLNLKIDVLMTYKDIIKNTLIHCTESNNNKKLSSYKVATVDNPTIKKIEFPNKDLFNPSGSILMTTITTSSAEK